MISLFLLGRKRFDFWICCLNKSPFSASIAHTQMSHMHSICVWRISKYDEWVGSPKPTKNSAVVLLESYSPLSSSSISLILLYFLYARIIMNLLHCNLILGRITTVCISKYMESELYCIRNSLAYFTFFALVILRLSYVMPFFFQFH